MSTVKSVYAHLDCLVDGIAAMKQAGLRDNLTVTAPLPRHEIEEMLYEGRPSPVRWFTMTGAILGGICGFALASITHLNWPMIIPAGKPLVSIPAFIVITFEATILWGCMGTLVGMLINCRLPSYRLQEEVEDPRFSDDHFGIIVNDVPANRLAEVKDLLGRTGAVEVTGGEAANA